LVSFIGFTVSAFCHITLEPSQHIFTGRASGKGANPPNSKKEALQQNIRDPGPNNNYRNNNIKNSIKTSDEIISPECKGTSNDLTIGFMPIRDILSHKNMLIYVFTTFLQVFSSTFSLIFMDIFLTQLLQHMIWIRAVILFISFFSPVVMNIVLTPMASKRDVYDILRVLFVVKVGISLLALLCGRLGIIVGIFMICSRAVVESVFGLWVYVSQDVDDEHYVIYGSRKASNAFFFVSKTGQAAAPVFGWLMFVIPLDSSSSTLINSNVVDDASLFFWMVLVMLMSGSLQLLVWSMYSLRGNYLKDIKSVVSRRLQFDP